MKILLTVEFYHPSKGGAQEVIKQLAERLVKLGHEVTAATTRMTERSDHLLNGVIIRSFDITGNMVRGYQGDTASYTEFILHSEFDIILNYAAQQWATDLCLPLLDKIRARKIMVPCGFSGLYNRDYKSYFSQMPSWLKQYDAVVFLSGNYRDIDFARKNNVGGLHIIPNGCGLDEFGQVPETDIRQKLGIDPNAFLILHVGTHTGFKGHKELFKILKRAKIKDAVLLIVGNSISGGCARGCAARMWIFNHSLGPILRNTRTLVKDLNREDTVAAYHTADLFLFPSYIECSPLVLFEAMASKTPFLATDVGNSAEIIEWSGGGMLLATTMDRHGSSRTGIASGAQLMRTLWKNREHRERLAASGYETWKKRFTWEKITKEYEALFYKLLDEKGPERIQL